MQRQSRRRARSGSVPVDEPRDVLTRGNDELKVVEPVLFLIKLGQAPPKMMGIDADNSIQLGVETGIPAESLSGDAILADRLLFPVKILLT